MTKESIPYFEDQKSPMVPGKPTVERDMVYGIVINKKTNEMLCLDWYKHDWKAFVMGGIEEGEEIIISAMREIEEETGYSNLKFIAEVGKTKAAFFAAHKDVNRISNATALLFELIDETRKEVDPTEDSEHHALRIPKEKVAEYLNLENHKYVWQKALELLS